jgi:hypothetical protein
MNRVLRNTLCRLLIALTIWTPFQMASAAMVGTDEVVASTATLDRAHVMQALERSDVQSQLQVFGVDPTQAKDRVQAMSDEEVTVLAQRIDALPAGGTSAGAVILILVIIGVIWWAMSSGRMGR